MIKLTLPVPPSANRWHRVVNGRPILSGEARSYTLRAKVLATIQKCDPIKAPREIDVTIRWFRERKSGDVDKRGAVLLDALQGIAYENDSQIKRYTIERFDTDKGDPRMEIEVKEAA